MKLLSPLPVNSALYSLLLNESVVLAEMTDSGKLFQVLIIRVQKKYFLKYGWLALNYAPWFYNLDVFQN